MKNIIIRERDLKFWLSDLSSVLFQLQSLIRVLNRLNTSVKGEKTNFAAAVSLPQRKREKNSRWNSYHKETPTGQYNVQIHRFNTHAPVCVTSHAHPISRAPTNYRSNAQRAVHSNRRDSSLSYRKKIFRKFQSMTVAF